MKRAFFVIAAFVAISAFAQTKHRNVENAVEAFHPSYQRLSQDPFSGLRVDQPIRMGDLYNSLDRGFSPSGPNIGPMLSCIGQKTVCTNQRRSFESASLSEIDFGDSTEGDQNQLLLLLMKGFERAVDSESDLANKYQDYVSRKYGEEPKWRTSTIANQSNLNVAGVMSRFFGTPTSAGPAEWSKSLNDIFELKGTAISDLDANVRFKYWAYLKARKSLPQNPSPELKKLLAKMEKDLTDSMARAILQEIYNGPAEVFEAAYPGITGNSPTAHTQATTDLTNYLMDKPTPRRKAEEKNPLTPEKSYSNFLEQVTTANTFLQNREEFNALPDEQKMHYMKIMVGYKSVANCMDQRIAASVDGLQPNELTKHMDPALALAEVQSFDTEVRSGLIECVRPLLDPVYFKQDKNGKWSLNADGPGIDAPEDVLDLQQFLEASLQKGTLPHWNRIKTRYLRKEKLTWGDEIFTRWEQQTKGAHSSLLPKHAFEPQMAEDLAAAGDRLRERYNLTVRNEECTKEYANQSKTFDFGDYKTIKYSYCPQFKFQGAKVFLPQTDIFRHPEDLAVMFDHMGAAAFQSYLMTNVMLAKQNNIPFPLFGTPFPLFASAAENAATLKTLHMLICQQVPDSVSGEDHPCVRGEDGSLTHPALTEMLKIAKEDLYNKMTKTKAGDRYMAPAMVAGDPVSPLFATKKPYVLQDTVFVDTPHGLKQYDYIDYINRARKLVDKSQALAEMSSINSEKLLTFLNGLEQGAKGYFDSAGKVLLPYAYDKVMEKVRESIDYAGQMKPHEQEARYQEYLRDQRYAPNYSEIKNFKSYNEAKSNAEAKKAFNLWLLKREGTDGTETFKRYERTVDDISRKLVDLHRQFLELGIPMAKSPETLAEQNGGQGAHFTDAYAELAFLNSKQIHSTDEAANVQWNGNSDKMPTTFMGVLNANLNPFSSYELGLAGNGAVITAGLVSLPVSVRPMGGMSLGVSRSLMATSKVAYGYSKARLATLTYKSLGVIGKLGIAEKYENFAAALGTRLWNMPLSYTTKQIPGVLKQAATTLSHIPSQTVAAGEKTLATLGDLGVRIHHSPADLASNAWQVTKDGTRLVGSKLKPLVDEMRLPKFTQARLKHAWDLENAKSLFYKGYHEGKDEAWRMFWMMKLMGAGSSGVASGFKHGVAWMQGDSVSGKEWQLMEDQVLQALIGGNGAKDLLVMNSVIRTGDWFAKGASNLAKNVWRPRRSAQAVQEAKDALLASNLKLAEKTIQNYETRAQHFASQGQTSQAQFFTDLATKARAKATTINGGSLLIGELRAGNIIGNIPMSLYFNNQSWEMVQAELQSINQDYDNNMKQAQMEEKRGNYAAAEKLRKDAEHLRHRKFRAWASFVVDVSLDVFMTYKFMSRETWASNEYRPKLTDHRKQVELTLERFVKSEGLVREPDGSIEMSPDQYRRLTQTIGRANRDLTAQIDKYILDRGDTKPEILAMRGSSFMPFSVYDETPAITNLGLMKIWPADAGWILPQAP
ncbi:MAG TPA: hypothetical protein VM901_01040 [Bdellovibrionota bacterium]|jgi:hypothetical protein|nr:hypothetical protein [Bdellovibrionota bacterium]